MVIEANGLSRSYGDVVALKGISLSVKGRGVVGLLGPNGAGKTTFVEIVEGLRERTSGSLRVLGLDPARDARALKERLGVQLQATTLPQDLTCREVLRLFASFYRRSLPVDGVLARVDLSAKAGARVRTLSGGQQQRLALGLALVNDPELLVLDEPTAGLDPAARRALHEVVRQLAGEGRTVLMTTHYIEEAELLCDRVVMLRGGEIVADGTPLELLARSSGSSTLWLVVDGILDPSPLTAAGCAFLGRQGDHWKLATGDPAGAIMAIGTVLRSQNLNLIDLRMKRPTLEDVYLELLEAPPAGLPAAAAGAAP